jgi:hypothetical protein
MSRGITIETGVSNTKYLSVSKDGKFVERVRKAMTSEEHEEFKHEMSEQMSFRVLTKGVNIGKIVWERKIREFEGQIVDIKFDDTGAYGAEWTIRVDVTEQGGKKAFVNLQFNANSDIANSVVLKMPNIKEFKNDVRFMAYSLENDKDGNKMEYSRQGIAVYTEGVKVAPFYTKANTGGMPKWKKVTVNGKQTVDKTDALEFIKNMMLNEVLPKVKEAAPTEPEPDAIPEVIPETVPLPELDEDGDELPF